MSGIRLSLAVRTQIIIAVTLTGVFSVCLYLSLRALQANFIEYETHSALDSIARAKTEIDDELSYLETASQAYGVWDDTVHFIEGTFPGYASNMVSADQYNSLGLDFIVITDLKGEVKHQGLRLRDYPGTSIGKIADRKDGLADIPDPLLRKIMRLAPVGNHRSGLVGIDGLVTEVAGFNVLPTSGKGPAYGTIFMGKVMDSMSMRKSSDRMQTNITIKPASSDERMTGDKPVLRANLWITSKVIQGLDPHSYFLLTTSDERDLLAQLNASRWVLAMSLLVISIASMGTIGLVLHSAVLKRVSDFALQADRMRKGQDDTLRMPTGGSGDELDYLAEAINELLDELQAIQQQLVNDAQHDPLTWLGNRSTLMNRLELACAMRNRDPEYRFALYLFDLDGFKNINDSFGHNTGDQVLRVVAERILSEVRQTDTAARLGGDEFVIIQMKAGSQADCETFAGRLLGRIAEPFHFDGQTVDITASMGICLSSDRPGKCVSTELLRDADIAMYSAKQEGKNRHSLFCSEMGSIVSERLLLVHDIKGAIEQGELEVWYQPIVSLKEGWVREVEALVRWRHPIRGLLSPDRFIPLAEESTAIISIDRWVMAQALAGIRRMREIAPDISVSVNVSIRNFLQPDLHAVVAAGLENAGLTPQALCVELTETDLARNEIALVGPIRKLADMGVRCLLDDFGSGYSSLGRLDLLPVHVLKMDRSFIRRIDEGDIRIVAAVITMAHALGKKVVAEGVETDLQVDILESLGCDLFQGFRFARPMPEADLIKLLKNGDRLFNRAGALD